MPLWFYELVPHLGHHCEDAKDAKHLLAGSICQEATIWDHFMIFHGLFSHRYYGNLWKSMEIYGNLWK